MSNTLLFVREFAAELPANWQQHFWTLQFIVDGYVLIKFKNWWAKN